MLTAGADAFMVAATESVIADVRASGRRVENFRDNARVGIMVGDAGTLIRYYRKTKARPYSLGIVRQHLSKRGYWRIRYSVGDRSGRKVFANTHRLMAEAFLGLDHTATKILVRHLNDCRTDNRIENMALGTHKDNLADAVRNGKRKQLSGVGRGFRHDAQLGTWVCCMCRVPLPRSAYHPKNEKRGYAPAYCIQCCAKKNAAYREKRRSMKTVALSIALGLLALTLGGCATTVVSVTELKLNHAGWQTQRQFVDAINDPTLKASATRHVDAMEKHAAKMVEEASK